MNMNNQKLVLESPIPVSVNHYLGYKVIKRGKAFLPASYVTAKAKKYKTQFTQYVREQCAEQGWVMSDNPFQHYYVDVTFYFPSVGLDCNNHWKVMLDAITESQCVWHDDHNVLERAKRIYFDSENPHLEIVIRPVEYIGIFDDVDSANAFDDRCSTCKRGQKGNCSINKKAKEGRIQPEVDGCFCLKYKKGVTGHETKKERKYGECRKTIGL